MDSPEVPSRLCVTGAEPSQAALAARLDRADSADLQEVRLDHLRDLDDRVWDLVRRHGPRVVATCRRAVDLGAFAGSEEQRLDLLCKAAAAGAAWVDVEADVVGQAGVAGIPAQRTVASLHAPDVAALDAAAGGLAGLPAAMIKVAAPVTGAADLLALRRVRERLGDRPAVVVGMGDAGLWTRIRPGDVGSAWSFVAAAEGLSTAPGQITRDRAIALRVLESHRLRPIAVVGGPQVVHSLGTDVYNRLFAAGGLDLQYLPLPANRWEDVEAAATTFGILGLSVTMPLKRAAFDAAVVRDESAATLGAANTLVRLADGTWRAANTDVIAARWLLAGLGLRAGHAVRVLGTGATAVTLAFAADGLGAHVTLAVRSPERCRLALASLPHGIAGRAAAWAVIPWEQRAAGRIDLLANGTPVGAEDQGCPWADDAPMPPRVLDVVRPPNGTSQLVQRARASGRRAVDGLAFWCRQGAAQAALLAGLDVSPRDLLEQARRLGRADGLPASTPPLPPEPQAGGRRPVRIRVPGSKSVTQRALMLAALADSPSMIGNASPSDDSLDLTAALATLGARFDVRPEGLLVTPGALRLPSAPVPCGEGATTARFIASLALRIDGPLVLGLGSRLRERPWGAHAKALEAAGVELHLDSASGRLTVQRRGPTPAEVVVDLTGSSQPASGLLLVAPGLPGGLRVRPSGAVASRSYLDLTLAWLRRFGVDADDRDGVCTVSPCAYPGRSVESGGDWSLAAFWMAAERVTGRRAELVGLDPSDGQGDVVFASLLQQMDAGGDRVLDLGSVPDLLPPMVVAALFADGPVRIGGVAHARQKESDRPAVLAQQFGRLGARISETPDGLVIEPGPLHGPAVLDPSGDHRMAMAFGLVSLVVPGLDILDPGCVTKSYPGFWEDLEAYRCAR
jgi:3-phosphoshikimate 1-carboxyvinyltransferase